MRLQAEAGAYSYVTGTSDNPVLISDACSRAFGHESVDVDVLVEYAASSSGRNHAIGFLPRLTAGVPRSHHQLLEAYSLGLHRLFAVAS